jgi:Na+-transporting methylmalonyl-CoA/oxaloacetate decarboxylase gamma subunit
MQTPLASALLITLIGMGLVFVVILALWGLMALIVLIRDPAGEDDSQDSADEVVIPAPRQPEGREWKQRAAAAAVAIALALEGQKKAEPVSRPAQAGTSWQTVMRFKQIESKNPRGRR